MFLFILESIGTAELLLIGIVALVFLGPRKLPEMARKAGKIMAEFRGTAAEFKETWQREVNFEEEAKEFKDINFDEEVSSLNLDDAEPEMVTAGAADVEAPATAAPSIRDADPSEFESLMPASDDVPNAKQITPADGKENWL